MYQAALGDCLIGLAFMMEASTPFVSARAILELLGEAHLEQHEKCSSISKYFYNSYLNLLLIFSLDCSGMKRSTPYMLNGIAMLVVFLFCRVLLMPYTYYLYGQQIGRKTQKSYKLKNCSDNCSHVSTFLSS